MSEQKISKCHYEIFTSLVVVLANILLPEELTVVTWNHLLFLSPVFLGDVYVEKWAYYRSTFLYIVESYGSGEVVSCASVTCEVTLDLKCPNDTMVVGIEPSENECCSSAPSCQCNPCPTKEPMCEEGFLQVLKSLGTGQPGTCCSMYECKEKGRQPLQISWQSVHKYQSFCFEIIQQFACIIKISERNISVVVVGCSKLFFQLVNLDGSESLFVCVER